MQGFQSLLTCFVDLRLSDRPSTFPRSILALAQIIALPKRHPDRPAKLYLLLRFNSLLLLFADQAHQLV
jgi:hypothetical protein